MNGIYRTRVNLAELRREMKGCCPNRGCPDRVVTSGITVAESVTEFTDRVEPLLIDEDRATEWVETVLCQV